MASCHTPAPTTQHELLLTRLIPTTPDKVYRAWTEPALLKQWFVPRPWTTPTVEVDVRPGGSNYFATCEIRNRFGWGRWPGVLG